MTGASQTASGTALQIRGLRKRFPDGTRALDGVDLIVGRGQVFGLLGPNGAGKSTLINIVTGLVRADAGSVAVFGHDHASDAIAKLPWG